MRTPALMVRLRFARQFQGVMQMRPLCRTTHFALHRAPAAAVFREGETPPLDERFYLGLVIPKRFAKRAVTRNVIRRQMYAWASETFLDSAAYVVRLTRTFDPQQFISATSTPLKQAIRHELTELAQRCIQRDDKPL